MKSRIAMMQLPSLVAMAASNRATFSSRVLYQSSEYDYQYRKSYHTDHGDVITAVDHMSSPDPAGFC